MYDILIFNNFLKKLESKECTRREETEIAGIGHILRRTIVNFDLTG